MLVILPYKSFDTMVWLRIYRSNAARGLGVSTTRAVGDGKSENRLEIRYIQLRCNVLQILDGDDDAMINF